MFPAAAVDGVTGLNWARRLEILKVSARRQADSLAVCAFIAVFLV
jgi:hypothetical protein